MAIEWPYIVEDNFLNKQHFDFLLKFYTQDIKDDSIGISKNKIWLDGNVEGKLNKKYLTTFYNDYSEKLASYLKKLAPERINSAKWLELNLVWSGKQYKHRIHEDSPNKLLSVVIYLHPEESSGTFLYSDQKGSDKTEVEWIKNRALIFARQEGVTWHSYEGDGKSNRFALVVNVRSDI